MYMFNKMEVRVGNLIHFCKYFHSEIFNRAKFNFEYSNSYDDDHKSPLPKTVLMIINIYLLPALQDIINVVPSTP